MTRQRPLERTIEDLSPAELRSSGFFASNAWPDLLKRYGEPHRFYHNLTHLAEFAQLHAQRSGRWQAPVESYLALLYHDAVYDPQSKDNEQRSAELAIATLAGFRTAGPIDSALVASLVLHTASHAEGVATDDPDVRAFLDCDTAILGSSADRYAEYARGVRAEYSFVPEALYRQHRASFLERMLARTPLYLTAEFEQRYAEQARTNLRAELSGALR